MHSDSYSEPREDAAVRLGVRRENAGSEPPAAVAPSGERGALLGKFVAVGFWATFVSLIVGAATSGALLAFALIPIIGMGYFVFCLIALTGDRNVEVSMRVGSQVAQAPADR
jgi:hypothetical protein